MEKVIKHVYNGLPDHFKNKVLWVGRQYRVNTLSHQPGGFDVIVEYHEGGVLGYDWIKYPSKYISKIFTKQLFQENKVNFEVLERETQLTLIKEKIYRIFARKFKDDNEYEIMPYKELWNSLSSTEIPWNVLERLEKQIEKEICLNDLLKKNIELFKKITAVHYPFTQNQLELYWNKIPKGSAHYAEYLGDTETWYEPEYGLCWNYNVEWTDWLRNKWLYFDPNIHNDDRYVDDKLEIGFWDPFTGQQRGPRSVPLDIAGEDDIAEKHFSVYMPEPDESEEWFKGLEKMKNFFESVSDNLSVDDVALLLENEDYPNSICHFFTTSKRIWFGTFSKWITEKEITFLFG